MKKYLFLLIFIALACEKTETTHKPIIITTLFPQYDFAKQIVQDKMEVKLLLPAGVEPHHYEPTAKDILQIAECRLFIYTNENMEPWVKKIIQTIQNPPFIIVDASKNIPLLKTGQKHHHHHKHSNKENEKHECQSCDPHIWLDPLNAKTMVDTILENIILVDNQNKTFYEQNAEKLKQQLQKLHEDFQATFQKTKHKTIVYTGHFAFGYFVKRYGLDFISPYTNISPNAEINAQKLSQLIQFLQQKKIKAIYYEELIHPKAAETIAKETGATMYLLHGVHNLSAKELADPTVTYVSLMRQNLENLKKGLEYQE